MFDVQEVVALCTVDRRLAFVGTSWLDEADEAAGCKTRVDRREG
jgi:hypothetical protein